MAISTIGTDALAASAVTSTKLASGVPSRSQLPAGTVLQVVSTTKNDTWSTSSTSDVAVTGLSATITPTSSTSKILILMHVGATSTNTSDYATFFSLYRGGSIVSGAVGNASGTRKVCSFGHRSSAYPRFSAVGMQYLDSPASTSSLTYQLYAAMESGGGSSYVNISGVTADGASVPLSISNITFLEIAA